MAKKFELHERGTNDIVYPITLAECTYHNGETLDTIIDNKAERSELSNVLSEEVVDDTTFEDFDKVTREELKKDLFIDMWERACVYNKVRYGKYDKERDLYILNDVELTYEEALYTYQRSAFLFSGGGMPYRFYNDKSIKTNFPITFGACVSREDASLANIFNGCINLEIAVITTNYNAPTTLTGAFEDCSKLREIRGMIQNPYYGANATLNTFKGCSSLQLVKIQPSKEGLNFSDCPKLNYESVKFPVYETKYLPNCTITIHPSIYNALLGQDTQYPFNGGTQEEWEQLLEDATAKNIQFATA